MPTIDTLLVGGQLLWLLSLASLLVGLSKGGLPAVGMLAVPILSLTMSPVLAAVLLLPIYILSDTVGVWLYRREYSADNLRILMPAGFAGVLVGWATAAYTSDQMVSLLIGVLGVGFCLNTWVNNYWRGGKTVVPTTVSLRKGVFWGTLSGFTSFVSHAGAPPYQIYVLPQKLPKMIFAGTSTILFAAVNLAKVVPYASLHPYTIDTLKVSAVLLPLAAIGTILGRHLVKRLSEKWFYLGVQMALFAISWKLIFNAV